MINSTCKSRLRFSLGKVQLIKNTLKQTKFEVETVKPTHLSLVLVGLYDIIMFGHSLFLPSRQSNIPSSGQERFKYPLPRKNKISQMPHSRANKDNQIPTPCPASLPPPPRQLYIDRCIKV